MVPASLIGPLTEIVLREDHHHLCAGDQGLLRIEILAEALPPLLVIATFLAGPLGVVARAVPTAS